MQRSYCREGKKMILHEVLSPGPSHSYRPLDPGHGPKELWPCWEKLCHCGCGLKTLTPAAWKSVFH